LEQRLTALERAVEQIQAQLAHEPAQQRHWWQDDAGRFADDPVFDEFVRLGREYRESLRPHGGKKKHARF
jgi:hypothetical protein